MSPKFSRKDEAWPPAGVRDLKPDVPVKSKADPVQFPILREALERATLKQAATAPVTPTTLTEQIVRYVLQRNSRYRDVEYLCRAYLQFGSTAMPPDKLQLLCAVINKCNK